MKENDGSRLILFPDVLAAIREIAADNRSGAAEILHRAVEVFSRLSEAAGGEDSRFVAAVCAALLKAQPAMAPIANLVAEAQAAADSAPNPREALMLASLAARKFADWAANAAEAAAEHAAALITEGSSVLTHSRSSTVMNAFSIARREGRRFGLFVTESRPMMEGRAVAAQAAELGAAVTLIADASAALIMDSIDLVIVGADKVTRPGANATGGLVNKIGTRMIALAARECGRPVYAVCDTSKFDKAARPARPAPQSGGGARNPDELWPGAPEDVRVLNRYFEETPLDLLTGIVTEDGIWPGNANCQFA